MSTNTFVKDCDWAPCVQDLGHSLSAYASHILEDNPELGNGIEDQHKGLHASAARGSVNTNACDSKPSSSTASSQSTPHQVPASQLFLLRRVSLAGTYSRL